MFPIDYFLSFQLQLARNGLLSGGNFATIQYRYKTVSIKITVIIQRYNQSFTTFRVQVVILTVLQWNKNADRKTFSINIMTRKWDITKILSKKLLIHKHDNFFCSGGKQNWIPKHILSKTWDFISNWYVVFIFITQWLNFYRVGFKHSTSILSYTNQQKNNLCTRVYAI